MDYDEPFYAGKEVQEPYFFNRINDIKELKRKITSSTPVNIALYGQRRIGKSSILRKLRNDFALSTEVIPIMIRCEIVIPKTPENFARLIINSLRHLTEDGHVFAPKNEEEILKRVKRRRVEYELSSMDEGGRTETLKATSEFKDTIEGFNLMMDVAFELIKEIQKTNEAKLVFLMDEFQELFSIGDDFLWALKGYISETNASFIVSSSHHRFYEFLASDKNKPFFNFFNLKSILGIKHADAKKYIVERLKIVNKKINNEALKYVLTLSEGKPFYIQLLCSEAYDILLRKQEETINVEILKQAFDNIFISPPNHIISSFKSLEGVKTQQVFITMCLHDLKTSTDIAEKLGNISASSVRQILNQLERLHGIIKKSRTKTNRFQVVDKFLKEWIKREYS